MAKGFVKFVLSVALLAGAANAGDIIDRIVAVVNGHVILQSQWDESVAYEALRCCVTSSKSLRNLCCSHFEPPSR